MPGTRAPLVSPPTLPPGLLITNLVGTVLSVGLGAVPLLATLHLQQLLGVTPLDTGLAYLALALPSIPLGPVDRLGRRPTCPGRWSANGHEAAR